MSAHLTRYLDAIGAERSGPTLETLTTLIQRHLATFPFTSVGPVLGDPLPLTSDAIFERIVEQGRGGYCFEHNSLFFDVLNELGFTTRLVMAGVMFTTDDPPLDHRTTLVTLPEGDFIADVGLGWPTPNYPVPLSGEATGDSWREFRAQRFAPQLWQVQSLRKGRWSPSYRFELGEFTDDDCAVGHATCGQHPDSQFVNNVIASLVFSDEIRSLRNKEYRVLTPRETNLRNLDKESDFVGVLVDELAVKLSSDELKRLWDVAGKHRLEG